MQYLGMMHYVVIDSSLASGGFNSSGTSTLSDGAVLYCNQYEGLYVSQLSLER